MWNTVITKDPAYVCRTNDAHFFFFLTVVFFLCSKLLWPIFGEKRKKGSLRLAGCGAQPKAITLYAAVYSGASCSRLQQLPFGHCQQRGILLYYLVRTRLQIHNVKDAEPTHWGIKDMFRG